jgi:hypothetical protein
LVECWVVVPRDAGSNPVFRAFSYFLGALTSKTYSFQYRTWELQSQIFFDFSDYFYPLIKLQFRGPELIRVLPVPTFWLSWISDTIRFNFSFLFNIRSLISQFVFLLPSKSYFVFFKFFNSNFFSGSFFSFSNFLSFSSDSFYPKQTPPIKFVQSSSTNQFFLFYFSNIKELSPSYTAFLRTDSSVKLAFFGSFFDINFSRDSVSFFPTHTFFQSTFLKTTYLTNIFKNSIIRIFSAISIKTFPNFEQTNKNFNFLSPFFNTLNMTSSVFPISTFFPIFFSNNHNFFSYNANINSFLNLSNVNRLISPFPFYVRYSLSTPSVYSKEFSFSVFMNMNSYLLKRVFMSPYSKLFSFRKIRKAQSIYLSYV